MLIVDSQVHIWAANTPSRPWPPGRHQPHRTTPFTASDLLAAMDGTGVDAAVIVPPSWEGDRNDLALTAAAAHPQRLAVMGRLDPDSADARERLTNWRDQPGMLGLRFTLARPEGFHRRVESGDLDWLWADAERLGLPVMLMAEPAHLDVVARIAERHPGLRLVMDHMAREPDCRGDAAFARMERLIGLARFPNVAVKASGMPAYSDDGYPYRRMFPYLRRAFDAFGPKRLFWGTDLTKLPCSYSQARRMFTDHLDWLRGDDLAWVMGRGLCAWLDWRLSDIGTLR